MEEDYFSGPVIEDEDELISNFASEMGSFNYMPKNFLGFKTSEFGFVLANTSELPPYLKLKEKIINEAKSLTVEDRMQAVRYLCSIPFNNSTIHCVEAALSIIKDDSIDIYKRFYFLNNRDRYFSLDDHVVNLLHPLFFKYGLSLGPSVVPYEIMIVSAKYILERFGAETKIRQVALDWCLDIIENDNEDIGFKLKIFSLLKRHGQPDEQQFALDQLEELGVEDPDEVEQSAEDKLARDILRAIRTNHTITNAKDDETTFYNTLTSATKEPSRKDLINDIFNFITTSSESFEGISLLNICLLFYREVEAIKSTKSIYFADECLRRFVDTMSPQDDSQRIVQILLILADFTTPREFFLGPSNLERLRNDIFAALNACLFGMPDAVRSTIQESRNSEDKSAVKEFFILYFDDEKDILKKSWEDKISPQEFEKMYDQVTKEWSN